MVYPKQGDIACILSQHYLDAEIKHYRRVLRNHVLKPLSYIKSLAPSLSSKRLMFCSCTCKCVDEMCWKYPMFAFSDEGSICKWMVVRLIFQNLRTTPKTMLIFLRSAFSVAILHARPHIERLQIGIFGMIQENVDHVKSG